jgi:hypothetical protein
MMMSLHPSRCVKCGEITPQTVTSKRKAVQPSAAFARVIILPTIKVVLNINYFLNVAKQSTCYRQNKNIVLTSPLIKSLSKDSCASITGSNNILLPNSPMNDIPFSQYISDLVALINLIFSLLLLLQLFYAITLLLNPNSFLPYSFK